MRIVFIVNLLLKSTLNRQSLRYKSTVFALSSGLGKCGVAVIRVSGPEASIAIKKMTNIKDFPEPRTAVLKNIRHPITQEIVDRGLLLWFPSPKSYTGEDSCEFHVHGGAAVISGVLQALSCLNNFKLAEPGEFTRRAFLNGKLNLTEVEGLADLLQAETEVQRKQAFLQSCGSLSKLYERWKHILTHSVANLEAFIDFEETETLEHGLTQSVIKDVELLLKDISAHVQDGHRGELLRHGVQTVIIGEPNVGKSSLLNLLCQRPASIVTPISGTTRDVIEVKLNIGGYPLVLADTAGLRHSSQDVVELEGMSRALEMYRKSKLVLLVVDLSNYLSWSKTYKTSFKKYIVNYTKVLGIPDLIKENLKNSEIHFTKECIIVMNKKDLFPENITGNLDSNVVKLSCKTEDGTSDLIDALRERLKLLCGEPSEDHPSMNQQRHRNQVNQCRKSLELFLQEASKENADVVIMAECLRKAIRNLGKLIGTVTSEEILDVIFREFCIGK